MGHFVLSLRERENISPQKHVVGTDQKCLTEAFLMSTHNICFCRDVVGIQPGTPNIFSWRNKNFEYRQHLICLNSLQHINHCGSFCVVSQSAGNISPHKYVVGTHQKCPTEAFLMSTHNICFCTLARCSGYSTWHS